MDKVILQYEADLRTLNLKFEELKKSMGGVETAGKKSAKEVEDGFKKTASNMDGTLGKALTRLKEQLVAVYSVDRIVSFAKESLRAYQEAQAGEVLLLNSLKGRKDIQERLIEQAKELQKRTVISDDAIVAQQVFLAAQGRTEAQIKKTIEAAVQLSAVTGDDLGTAVQKLDGTYEGVIGRLGKLDSGLKNLTQKQLENGGAVDLINEKYKGFAEALTGTSEGKMKQLANQFNDLEESFGKFVAAGLGELQPFLSKAISLAGTALENYALTFRGMGSRVIYDQGQMQAKMDIEFQKQRVQDKLKKEMTLDEEKAFVAKMLAVSEKLLRDNKAAPQRTKILNENRDIYMGEIDLYKKYLEDLNTAKADDDKKKAELTKEELAKLKTAREQLSQFILDNAAVTSKNIAQSTADDFEAQRKGAMAEADSEIATLKDKNEKIQENDSLSKAEKLKAEKSTADAIQAIQLGLVEKVNDINKSQFDKEKSMMDEKMKKAEESAQFEKDLFLEIAQSNAADAKTTIDEQKKKLKEFLDELIKVAEASATLINTLFELGKANRDKEIQDIDEKKKAELDGLEKQRTNKEISDKKYQASKLAVEKKFDEESAKIKTKQAIADKRQKEFNIIIQTAENVIKALAEPPPFGQILAAIVAAAGAAQIAVVEAQPIPKFAKGARWVNDSRYPDGIDTIPAYLSKGEAVIPRDKNIKYKDAVGAIMDDNFYDKFLWWKDYNPEALDRLVTNGLLRGERARAKQQQEKDQALITLAKAYKENGNNSGAGDIVNAIRGTHRMHPKDLEALANIISDKLKPNLKDF